MSLLPSTGRTHDSTSNFTLQTRRDWRRAVTITAMLQVLVDFLERYPSLAVAFAVVIALLAITWAVWFSRGPLPI